MQGFGSGFMVSCYVGLDAAGLRFMGSLSFRPPSICNCNVDFLGSVRRLGRLVFVVWVLLNYEVASCVCVLCLVMSYPKFFHVYVPRPAPPPHFAVTDPLHQEHDTPSPFRTLNLKTPNPSRHPEPQ